MTRRRSSVAPSERLLAKVGANGKQLTITALNDYSIQVPASDATQYQVILARNINDETAVGA